MTSSVSELRPPGRTVRLPGGLSARARPRALATGLFLTVAVAVLALTGVLVGAMALSPAEVWAALTGTGEQATGYLVWSVRLPRVLVAVLAGLALGAAGMVFQSVGRNPLASPDVIGFTAGASAGAVLQILVFDAGAAAVAGGAVAGGLVTGAAVFLLAYRSGLHGQRMVIVGIGLAAMLTAVTSYLLSRAEQTDVRAAAEWLVGSLNGRTWEQVLPVAVLTVVLLPALVPLLSRLRTLELGEDSARALGVRPDLTRLLAMLIGVGLTAGAVAAAGPVPFVALAAPQIAARMSGGGPTALWSPALCGAALLLAADTLAQWLFPGGRLPVGVVTAAVGGLYLATLLRWGRRVR
ncbi:iron chelate uptake ABC transporter family permease subunit [Streptosporangium sp. NPDC051022]|uniref:FecCD family ABC transporter permease n=1 Tax=Streptosporangium sp. NPDC051022 TaxID=3155752 RepID=UPI0034457514